MQPTIIEHEPIILAGLVRSFSMNERSQIPALWGEFTQVFGDIDGPVEDGGWGVRLTSTTKGKDFDYMAAVSVLTGDQVPSSMEQRVIDGGRFACFPHDGPVSEMSSVVDNIFRNWMPTTDLPIRKGPVSIIEEYSPEFDPQKPGGMALWIPLQA